MAPGPATSPKLALLKGLWVEREGNQRCPESRGVTLLWALFPPTSPLLLCPGRSPRACHVAERAQQHLFQFSVLKAVFCLVFKKQAIEKYPK